jgi:hypothetical protein
VINLKPQPLFPLGRSLRHHLGKRLGRSQSHFRCYGKEKNLLPLLGIEPRQSNPLLAVISTELSTANFIKIRWVVSWMKCEDLVSPPLYAFIKDTYCVKTHKKVVIFGLVHKVVSESCDFIHSRSPFNLISGDKSYVGHALPRLSAFRIVKHGAAVLIIESICSSTLRLWCPRIVPLARAHAWLSSRRYKKLRSLCHCLFPPPPPPPPICYY